MYKESYSRCCVELNVEWFEILLKFHQEHCMESSSLINMIPEDQKLLHTLHRAW